jgi:uncharacterized protein (TIGR00369 family)
MPAADWPFLDTMPPERVALQRQLVDDDPFLGSLGVRFRDARADAARLTLAFRDGLAQPTGILHGGLHGILIDTAIAQSLLTTIRPGFSVVTVRLDTNYFAPVRAGVVTVDATVVRKGKRIAHGEAVVTDENEGVVARGWGVFAVVGAALPR